MTHPLAQELQLAQDATDKFTVNQLDPMVEIISVVDRTSYQLIKEPDQRHPVFCFPADKPTVILKSLPHPRQWVNEISGWEMAKVCGMDDVVPRTIYWTGTICNRQVHYVQEFIPDSETIHTWIPGRDFLRIEFTRAFELRSLQRAIVLGVILGVRDTHNKNALAQKVSDLGQHRVWLIDLECIMPISNDKAPLHIFSPNSEPDTLPNLPSVGIGLAGVPQASMPFQKSVLREILGTLSCEKLTTYHTKTNRFSKEACAAQRARVKRICSLFKQALTKDTIGLTPRDLVVDFIGKHSTYVSLTIIKLQPVFLFAIVGTIPHGYEENAKRNDQSLVTCLSIQWVKDLARLLDLQKHLINYRLDLYLK